MKTETTKIGDYFEAGKVKLRLALLLMVRKKLG